MHRIRFVWVYLVLIILVSCISGASDAYVENILRERAVKDSTFVIVDESPLEEADIAAFRGLSYFDVDTFYRVNARFVLNPDPQPFEMPTTTERRPIYVHYGTAYFSLNGKDLKLNIYQNQELITRPGYEKHLFIPFRDLTSGKETYGGGRFIDGEIPEGGHILIDFNTAYYPYCAYNHKYSCPIPPAENTLDVAIQAGERNKE